jgi:outer membrane protein, heavy metal efflux system
MIITNRLGLILFVLLLSIVGRAQNFRKDTLELKLPEVEKVFLDSNLLLLAQRYNIEAQRALVIQAKLWPNPNLSYGRGPVIPLNDPTSQFPHSNFVLNAENSASLSQLILLAGKRNKQIKIAEANTELAEYQFFDLLRTLKYTLRSDFFNVYYLGESSKVYHAEIKALQQVVEAFASQEGKGYIAESEVVRIRAQLYSFQSEYTDLLNQIKGIESELRLILHMKPTYYVEPLVDSTLTDQLNPSKYTLNTLLDSAFKNRTDLLIARANTNINRLNYSYQKALAVPDLDVSLNYDKQGSYALYYNGIGVDMDLPFLNRNQGNIKSAKAQIENTIALEKNAVATISENVTNSLEIAYEQDKLFQSIDRKFSDDFERLVNEVLINYQRRNIGLLAFLDFYDAYKQNMLQINSIKYNRVQSFEDLNFFTGTNFFN